MEYVVAYTVVSVGRHLGVGNAVFAQIVERLSTVPFRCHLSAENQAADMTERRRIIVDEGVEQFGRHKPCRDLHAVQRVRQAGNVEQIIA